MDDINQAVALLKAKGWGLFAVDQETAYKPDAIAEGGAVDSVMLDTYYHLMPYAKTPMQVLAELKNVIETGQPPYFSGVLPNFTVDGIIFGDDAAYLQPSEFDEQLRIPYPTLEKAIEIITPYDNKIRFQAGSSKLI